MAHSQSPSIHYTLGMSRPSSHLFELEVAFTNLPGRDKHLDFIMPSWRTGRYVIFDFAGSVQEFSAVDVNEKLLQWAKTDKQTWRVEKRGSSVTVRYKIFANEFNMRTKGLNDEHGFVDPASAFMYVDAYKHLPVRITVKPFVSWHVTTGLDAVKGSKTDFTAPNYEYLADCPIEIGTQKEFEFDVEGKKHVLMIQGEGNWDEKKLIPDISKIIRLTKQFWGELPYERYIFMVHLLGGRGSATEHINSTIIDAQPMQFSSRQGYRRFLATVTHEFFHTWNVKRLRPAGIHPYNFSKENYVKELWIAEGSTDYYEFLFLTRGGWLTPDEYFQALASFAQEDRLRPGNLVQSLTESSFDAWVKHYRDRENAYSAQTDYYVKGANVSFLLDMEIRNSSGNKSSLDDVMKTMYHRFRLGTKGYTVDDFQKVAEEFAGKNLKPFFGDYVHGTKPLEWEKFFGYAGLELVARDTVMKPWLGVQTTDADGGARVTRLSAGSPADEAGLSQGDEIFALNGFRVRSSDFQQRIPEMKAGDRVRITVFRDDKLREFEVTLRNQEIPAYRLAKIKEPSELQKAIYQSWLKTSW
ncbi:MAG: M61 family metallopeptidase [Ignavibacteriales bacterium]|nr:M61 family metallopeptidase [Ignavibacteriales bacterium]